MGCESSHTSLLARNSIFRAYPFILIFVIGIISYSNALHGPFVFDDKQNIVEHKEIHLESLSPSSLAKLKLGGQTSSPATRRPVARISFAFNYYFGGLNTFGYHLVNLVIHLLTAGLVYLFLNLTLNLPSLRERYGNVAAEISLLSSLVFVAHPIQTQAVNYIFQRVTVLAAFFFMLTLYFYVQARLAEGRKQKALFVASALATLLALGSKETAITLPFFIAAYEYYFFQKLDLGQAKKKWLYAIIGLFLAATVLGLFYTGFDPISWLANKYQTRAFTPGQRMLTQLRIVIFYLSLLILPLPSRLNLDHHFPLSYSLFNPFTTLVCLCLVLGLIATSFYLAKKRPLVSFALIWFWGNLVLECSFLPLELIFEHRLYLPSVGLFLIFSIFLVKAAEGLKIQSLRKQAIQVGLLIALIIPLSSMTYQRNKVWQDKLTLWKDAAGKSPNKARPNYNLGHIYADRGQPAKAIAQYQRTLKLDPEFLNAHNNLGNIYYRQGKFKQAIAEYLEEIKHTPDNVRSYNNLANTYLERGLKEQALSYYKQALQIDPGNILAHYGLAGYYEKKGDYPQAVSNYQKALELEPTFALAMCGLGRVYQQQRAYPQALQAYQKALQTRPDLQQPYFHLAKLYWHLKNYDRAKVLYENLLQRYPDSADAHYNLGIVYSIMRFPQAAAQEYLATLELKPDHTLAYYGLAGHYERNGDYPQAISNYQKVLKLEPTFALAMCGLGRIYQQQGLFQTAKQQYLAILKLKPNHALAHKELGNIYLKSSNSAKALLHFEKSLALAPNQPQAGKMRQTIDQLVKEGQSSTSASAKHRDIRGLLPNSKFVQKIKKSFR